MFALGKAVDRVGTTGSPGVQGAESNAGGAETSDGGTAGGVEVVTEKNTGSWGNPKFYTRFICFSQGID